MSFGLLSIPFRIFSVASEKKVTFSTLHATCGSKVKQQYVCATDGEVLTKETTAKGYEHRKGHFVQFSEAELDKLESPRSDELELLDFPLADSIDPLGIEKSYFLGPDKGGDRAYSLLAEVLRRTGRVAVGRFFARGRERTVLVNAFGRGLVMHYMFPAEELRSWAEVDLGPERHASEQELSLATELVMRHACNAFEPAKYRDAYQDRVREAVEAKVNGLEVSPATAPIGAKILDLVEALARSVAA